MEVKRKGLSGIRIRSSLLYCVSIFFFSFCALFFSSFPPSTGCLEIRCRLAGKAESHFQRQLIGPKNATKNRGNPFFRTTAAILAVGFIEPIRQQAKTVVPNKVNHVTLPNTVWIFKRRETTTNLQRPPIGRAFPKEDGGFWVDQGHRRLAARPSAGNARHVSRYTCRYHRGRR